MKKILLILFVFSQLFLVSRNNVDHVPSNTPPRTLTSRAGTCVRGIAEVDLYVNNVRAKLLNSGDMWWNRTNSAKYGVPALTDDQIKSGQSQVNALFAGSIWISGKVDGNLRMAALKYSTESNQFWPGVIKQGQSTISKTECQKFDRFWVVKSDDIKQALGGVYTQAIKEWPGKGNQYLIDNNILTAEELSENLAPFYDANGDCKYDYTKGDLPSIKNSCTSNAQFAYADQMIFWVINDIGNDHTIPANTPIGVQINCLAFAFQSTDELNNMTFYTYDIYNKSNVDLNETYMSQFIDCDLGGPTDDYVGCDTVRSLGFCYNADDYDQPGTNIPGYLEHVPIIGVDFFEGPRKANGNPIGMSSFAYFVIGSGRDMSEPTSEAEYRFYQEGKSRTGKNLTYSTDCINAAGPKTNYCFAGDPSKPTEWSMCRDGYPPADLRFVQNSGPFTMTSGKKETITVGVVFVQPPVGSQTGCKPVMSYLQDADDKAQRLFDFNFKKSQGPDAPDLNILEASNELNITIENPISSNNFGEKYNEKDIDIPILGNKNNDTTYKFEGYLIYQLVSSNAVSTFADLSDKSKAKLVMSMDIKNNIEKAVNYKRQIINGQTITVVDNSLELNNKGITRELTIKEDLFQSESQKYLVNNKTYYFATVAFAVNNFKTQTDSQSKQIALSSKIKVFSGTPHNSDFWGIKTKAKYNQTLPVTRILGQGHGSYFLEIDPAHEAEIIANNKKNELKYLAGASPVLVKVTDPYKLKNVDFELRLIDSSVAGVQDRLNLKSSYWQLKDKATDSTIYSEGNLDRNFNQSVYGNLNSKLESYGISIGTGLADSIDRVSRNGNAVYDYIGSSITYTDSSKKWLDFLVDIDSKKYADWIRSGSNLDKTQKFNSAYNVINNKKVFTDSTKKFAGVLDKKFAPYCLAANTNILHPTSADNSYQSFGPGFKWRRLSNDSATMAVWGEAPENNLDSIFSFDLVITNDRTKWSKGIVLETGESQQFNEFNALKGQIRKGLSLDTAGQPDGVDSGRGWFPGYAINLETGVRMNVYFGENSRFRGKGGANMVWDPDSLTETVLGAPIYGGTQSIYVLNSEYDEGVADLPIFMSNFNSTTGTGTSQELNKNVAAIYRKFAWTCVPLLNSKFSFYDAQGKYSIPTDVRIKVRVQKPYAIYLNPGENNSVYEFSTKGLAPETNDSMKKSAFDKMTIVPNPYNAYSIYEVSPAQNIVKIVNVPKNSTITIFTTDGILVRKFVLNNSNTDYSYSGSSTDEINLDNSVSWDLRTSSGVYIASGTYYINVESPGLGSKVLKLFATMRSADVSNF